jgi:hypothetical protein
MDKADAKVSFGSRLAVFDSYAGRILLPVAAAQNGAQNQSADHRNKIEPRHSPQNLSLTCSGKMY